MEYKNIAIVKSPVEESIIQVEECLLCHVVCICVIWYSW